MNTECWAKVRQELLSEVGQAAYKNWIEPLDLVSLRDGVAKFGAPTSFFGNWVSRNYGDSIRSHFESEGVSVERLEFVTSSAPKQQVRSEKEQPAKKAAASAARLPSDGADLPAAPLDKRFTFDSFVVGNPNELARDSLGNSGSYARSAGAVPVRRTVHVPLCSGAAVQGHHELQGAVPIGRCSDGR